MPITALPTPPSRSDTPANFVAKADAFIAALPKFVTEANAQAALLTLASTTDTSATSNAIGTGAKTFTVSAGKSFQPGMYLVIADTTAPSTNSMYGQVTSYAGTSLVINVLSTIGSGTKTAWTISQSAAGGAGLGANTFSGDQILMSGAAIEFGLSTVASATNPDIWTNTSNNINYTGIAAATGFAAAPQAGVERTLICAAACSFTAGANMLIDGAESYVASAGDEVKVVAVTTTQFRLKIIPADGRPVNLLANSKIQPITASVAANALTLTLNPTELDFRSATLSSGAVNTRTIAAAISCVVPSTATLGTVNAVQSRLAVLAIDNAGTVELAVVNIDGGVNLDETGLISTTALSATSDLAMVVYSTTARTNVPYRVVGYVESTQATAGTWVTAPSTIQGAGGASALSTVLNAHGAAPMFSCRAWVNFNGTGTPAIKASGNVSSITDNAVGDYTINLITAMPDANYGVGGACKPSGALTAASVALHHTTAKTSSACRVWISQAAAASWATIDVDDVTVTIHR